MKAKTSYITEGVILVSIIYLIVSVFQGCGDDGNPKHKSHPETNTKYMKNKI